MHDIQSDFAIGLIDGLRRTNFQMRENMVRGTDGSSADMLAGLMR